MPVKEDADHRSARLGLPLCLPGRLQAGEGPARVPNIARGPHLHRLRRLDGRLHGRAAQKRRGEGLRCGRGLRPAGLEPAAATAAWWSWSARTRAALTPEMFPEAMDLAVMDLSVSFRCASMLPAVHTLLREGGAGGLPHKAAVRGGAGEDVGQEGRRARRRRPRARAARFPGGPSRGLGYSVMGLDYSPVRGPEGNIEYLAYLKKGAFEAPIPDAADDSRRVPRR